jgi:hypothetical protein
MVFGLANKPFAPNHIVYLGIVTRKTGNTVVEIYVKVQNGAELDELSDVAITNPVAGQALMRGATLWENRSLASADISDATSAATASKLVLRDATGGANFAAVGATSVTSTGAITTTGLNGYISTSGYDASITTTGDNGLISTTGQTASISTSGAEATIFTNGIDAYINTTGISAHIFTSGSAAIIETQGSGGYISSRSTFKLFDGTYSTTLSHAPTADRAIAFPNNSGTVALTNPSSGSQTFSGTQTFSGAVSATGQGQLASLSDSGVITKSLLNTEIGGNGVCALTGVVATGGTQTTTQFAQANGILSFGSTPLAGQAALTITYQAPNIIQSGSSYSSNTGGGGSIVDMRLNHALVVPIGMPSNATARDVEVRISFGAAGTSGTSNAKLGALSTTTGYGIKINKHPTNNTYQVRLTGRTCVFTNNITGATNASPIVVTNVSHGLQNGDLVEITNVLGNTAANGVFTVQNVATNTFELAGSTGNGVYSSGGQVARLSASSIELAPFTTQTFCFKWTASTNTVSLSIGDLDQSEVLSLNRIALTHNCSIHQTTGLRIGFSSVTDTSAFLGIAYGQPTMFRI